MIKFIVLVAVLIAAFVFYKVGKKKTGKTNSSGGGFAGNPEDRNHHQNKTK